MKSEDTDNAKWDEEFQMSNKGERMTLEEKVEEELKNLMNLCHAIHNELASFVTSMNCNTNMVAGGILTTAM